MEFGYLDKENRDINSIIKGLSKDNKKLLYEMASVMDKREKQIKDVENKSLLNEIANVYCKNDYEKLMLESKDVGFNCKKLIKLLLDMGLLAVNCFMIKILTEMNNPNFLNIPAILVCSLSIIDIVLEIIEKNIDCKHQKIIIIIKQIRKVTKFARDINNGLFVLNRIL